MKWRLKAIQRVHKMEVIPSQVRNNARVPTLSTLIQYSTRITSHSHTVSERNERDSNKE
jgi:hypothetical protein